MKNIINYGAHTFDDSDILSGSVVLSNSMMFDTLAADELTLEIFSDDLGNKKLYTVDSRWYSTVSGQGYVVACGDIRDYKYGDPIEYRYDGRLIGKYYIKTLVRIGKNRFRINATSAVGLWANTTHYGGVYQGEQHGHTAGNIIREILTGFDVDIDDDVEDVGIYGHLPIETSRDALKNVLFAIGAALIKTADGRPRVVFLRDITPIPIPSERIYMGGELNYLSQATDVQVTEHAYYKSGLDTEVSLFNNTGSTSPDATTTVTFKNPVYELRWNGADVPASWQYNENYCIVHGVGVLTGREYTHTTRIVERSTGRTGEKRIAKVENATLVTLVNSANVAARVADYQSSAEQVSIGLVMADDGITSGSLVEFTDPFGEPARGFVSGLTLTMSRTLKGDATIIKNYVPSHFGNNITQSELITYSRSWIVPNGVTSILAVLGGGGSGGTGGARGADGEHGNRGDSVKGGNGGAGGAGGEAGKINTVTVNVNAGDTITVTIGVGGSGGIQNGGAGELGTATTITVNGQTYTSDDGTVPPAGYNNPLTGETYALRGDTGIAGGKGGNYETLGEDVVAGGQTWTGGNHGTTWSKGSGSYRAYGVTGGGSGAAYGTNGYLGSSGTGEWYSDYLGNVIATNAKGGRGANGPDALPRLYTPNYSCGGIGGNGGGGGGAGGPAEGAYVRESYTGSKRYGINTPAAGGTGGNGSEAGQGGNGFALFFFQS